MSHTFESFSILLDDIWHAVVRAVRFSANAIATLSWPALLITAVLLAFALTLVPLALTLFAFFMLVKLAVGGLVIATRRERRHRSDIYKD